MKRISKVQTLLATVLVAIILISGCGKEEKAEEVKKAEEITLNIVWAEWDPADYLYELSRDYTEATGNIKVAIDKIPWPQFATKVFTAFAARDAAYDIVIGDSQWLGRGATQGHYVDLTDWMKTNGIDATMAPMALKYYGEYPKGSKKYYAVPAEADCNGFAYRKDLFEDPKEKEAFKTKYGYDLDIPETYDQLRDIAEFFTRPDDNLYGVALWYTKDYDGMTMGFQQVMWSFGGSYGDPDTHKVEGILNSDAAVEALEFYIDLKKFTPPGSENYYWSESLTAFQQGIVAMAMNYYAFLPGLLDETRAKHAKDTGFFAAPGHKGPDGEFRRFISIGGQGMSVSKYSKHQEEALDYIKWFCEYENQLKWAKLGGFATNKQVLESDEFKAMNPYNPAFVESMKYVRDFWAVPEYNDLLQSCQEQWNSAATGQKTAKQAMDELAKEHEAIFKAAGYYDE